MHTVAEIHGAVESAVEKLLNPDAYKGSENSVEALRSLGFGRSENVADQADFKEAHRLAKRYQHVYPQYKFITDYQLSKVEKKYNLERGELSRFKGSIPEKNIQDMINAKIHLRDVDIDFKVNVRRDIVWLDETPDRFASASIRDDNFRLDRDFRDTWMHHLDTTHEAIARALAIPVGFSGNMEGKRYTHRDYVRQLVDRQGDSVCGLKELIRLCPTAVFIVADPNLFERPAPELDPLVCEAVEGGFLVITAWGDEAQDPDVANARMN